jgi:transposase
LGAKRPAARVVVETCAEAFGVADAARKAGHEVAVVPATLVRSLGVGMRGIKTDVRDARNLAEASCRMKRLPSVHIPAEASRARKTTCGLREVLVETRTKLINSVRGWLRTAGMGPMVRSTPEVFPLRLRKHVSDRGGESVYRFENWKRARAPRWPYFLRSLARASRVR